MARNGKNARFWYRMVVGHDCTREEIEAESVSVAVMEFLLPYLRAKPRRSDVWGRVPGHQPRGR